MDSNYKRELIIDNFENPFHKEIKDEKEFIKANTHNESCIDNIDLYVKVVDNKIIITTSTSEFTLNCNNPSDFPNIDLEDSKNPIERKANEFSCTDFISGDGDERPLHQYYRKSDECWTVVHRGH